MSVMMIVMIFSIVICFAVIALTVVVTNKAYDVLPNSLKVDPHPEDDKKEESDDKASS